MKARGNRCGHDRHRPRLRLARPVPATLPLVFRTAMRAAEGILTSPARFPELHGFGQLVWTTRGRRRRTERLEAIVLLAKVLILRCDRVTLRVGTPRADGGCSGISEADLVCWTGLRVRRLERAMRDFRDAGYGSSHKKARQVAPGRWKGYPSVRQLSMLFFARCGVLEWLREERQRASEAQRSGRLAPVIDIRARRDLRRVTRAQALAAKRTRLH